MKKICEMNDKIILGQDGKSDSDEVRSIMAMCPKRECVLEESGIYGMLYNTIYAIQNKIRKGQGSVYESCPFVSDIQKSS